MKVNIFTFIEGIILAIFASGYAFHQQISLVALVSVSLAFVACIAIDLNDYRKENEWKKHVNEVVEKTSGLKEQLNMIEDAISNDMDSIYIGSNRCVVCGEEIPEGSQTCPTCFKRVCDLYNSRH